MISPVAANETRPVEQFANKRVAWASTSRLFWIIAVVSVLLLCHYQFWKLPSRGDRANWDYFSQVISRGGVPYRDVVNIKTPLSAYIGAAAIILTRPFGLREIYATRAIYLILTALTIAFAFLVASLFFNCRRVGLLAALILLGTEQFATLNSDGVQPKTPMVLFGLISLWAALRNRPLLAGSSAMLSALSWQPGLLFFGAALLAFTRFFTSWRDRAWLRLLAGASLPLLLFLAYLWAAGALGDFYRWCLHFNFSVYAPGEMRPISGFFNRISKMLAGTYHNSRFYFYLAIPGAIFFLWSEVRQASRNGFSNLKESAPRQAILIAALVYLLFCTINIQGGADLIPLLPFVAMFAALAVVSILNLIASRIARGNNLVIARRVAGYGTAVFCVLSLAFTSYQIIKAGRGGANLSDQKAEARQIASLLAPGDEIYVHGRTEVLVLTGLSNASKYFLLDRGKAQYLDQVEEGGFEGWLERMKAARPAVVVLDRMKKLGQLKGGQDTDDEESMSERDALVSSDLLAWVGQDYERYEGRVFTYYVRRQDR
jgi:hypothetical protein